MTDTQIPEACTTWSYRLRHLSVDLGVRRSGTQAHTLCNAEAFDQEEMDRWAEKWATKPRGRIADMPPCTKCARKAAKL